MSNLVKIREAERSGYFVEIESRNYGRNSHHDGYLAYDPENDEFTQILSYIVDHDWETASTSETCFMLLREKNSYQMTSKILSHFVRTWTLLQARSVY